MECQIVSRSAVYQGFQQAVIEHTNRLISSLFCCVVFVRS